jgi:hypothetical protein
MPQAYTKSPLPAETHFRSYSSIHPSAITLWGWFWRRTPGIFFLWFGEHIALRCGAKNRRASDEADTKPRVQPSTGVRHETQRSPTSKKMPRRESDDSRLGADRHQEKGKVQ